MDPRVERIDLNDAEIEELLGLRKHQPVDAGYTTSPNAIRSLIKKKLVIWWDEEPKGFVLTNFGRNMALGLAIAESRREKKPDA